MLDVFRELVVSHGGYVHSDLVLLVGGEAEHGQVSLSGVLPTERSLFVPWALSETEDQPGAWTEFLQSLGYTLDKAFWVRHSFAEGVLPVIGAANHNPRGGKIVESVEGIELYGVDFRYSGDPAHLKRMWGICE